MTDLADFLRARYGEIRALAEATTERQPYDEWDAVGAGGEDDIARSIWEVVEIARMHRSPAAIDLARHVAQHDPQYVIADIDAKLALLDDLIAERHHVNDGDCWYTCTAATEERDLGENCDDNRRGGPCDCGRDARVERRLRLLAQSFAGHADYLLTTGG